MGQKNGLPTITTDSSFLHWRHINVGRIFQGTPNDGNANQARDHDPEQSVENEANGAEKNVRLKQLLSFINHPVQYYNSKLISKQHQTSLLRGRIDRE